MPERAAATRRSGRASVVSPPQDPVRIQRHGLSRFVPVAIFLAVLGSIATGALKAVERGDRFGAIVPLIVIGAAAIGIWRARRRRRG
jgi:hypothetical protein